MTAENPRLHARDADDLVAAIDEAMTTQSEGAWRSSSGTVLGGVVRLFGRLGQIIINRVNEIPEQHFRAFLNEAEIDALPPRPAHTEVTFLPAADGPAEITAPAGTQVATRPAGEQPALIFETDRKITVTPTLLVKCVAVDPINAGDHTAVATGAQDASYPAFAGDRERDRFLYIGEPVPEDAAAEPLLARPAAVRAEHMKLSLIFDQTAPAAEEPDAPAPAADDRWAMRWLYWDGATWADLRAAGASIDEQIDWCAVCSEQPVASGRVDFVNLPELVETEVHEVKARWLAAQLTGGAVRTCLPLLQDIRIERTIIVSGAQDATVAAAFAAIQGGKIFVALDLKSPFQPFGPQPAALDAFYLRIDDALTKPGAAVTLALDIPDLPANLDDTSLLDQLQIVWEYSSANGWIELGGSRRGCPALEHMNLDDHLDPGLGDEAFPRPVLATSFFTRRKYLEYAVPAAYDQKPLPAPFINHGKVITDIYTGARFVQIPIPDGCKDLPEEVLINGCSTSATVAAAFRDKTCALTTQGEVCFRVPPVGDPQACAPLEVNGQRGYWLRARLVAGAYNVPRRVRPFPLGPQIDLPPDVYAPVVRELGVTFANYVSRRGPARVDQCWAKTDDQWRDLRADLARGRLVRPFTSTVEARALYLGFLPADPAAVRPAFAPGAWLELRLTVAEDAPALATGVRYEYWNGQAWRPLRTIDGTAGLQRTGYLGFYAPANHRKCVEFGQEAFWLRIVPVAPLPASVAAAPRVGAILLNTVPATNAESILAEVLGSSTGEAGQRLFLSRAPVLPDVVIEVLERELHAEDTTQAAPGVANGQEHATWLPWTRVESFYGADPESRCYMLDQASGTILFGDGKAGRIPPPGKDNIRAARYRTHRGAAGNIPARAISELRSTQGALGAIDRVVNRGVAAGGSDVESIPRVKRRGPHVLKHRGRAVTQEDYQWLALEAPGVARAYPLAATDAAGRAAPGWVTLVIVPAAMPQMTPEKRPLPAPALLAAVRAFIEARVLANLGDADRTVDGLHLCGPEYVEVSVQATLVTTQPERSDAVKLAVIDQLDAFLHPLTGGPERTGWVLGRDVYVSEVAAEIERVPGVDYVVDLALTAPTAQLWQLTLHDAHAAAPALVADPHAAPWLPAGSQISLIDEQIKLVVAEAVATRAPVATVAVYGFKAGDVAQVVGLEDGAPSVTVASIVLSNRTPAHALVHFAAPLDGLPVLPPDAALTSLDGRVRLPIRGWHTVTGDDGVARACGASVRTLTIGDQVGLVHAADRARIYYPLAVTAVSAGAARDRVFIPASHLACAGAHQVDVILGR